MRVFSDSRRDRLLAVLVFVAALTSHLPAWIQYPADPFSQTLVSDAQAYDEWARQIAGDGFQSQPVFHQAPLYPVLLSCVYRVSPASGPRHPVIALQVLLTSAALAGFVFLGRRFLADPYAGVAGAAIAILHGPFVFHSLKLFPVALALATQCGALLALAAARRRPTLFMAIAAGVALGFAALARAEVLLFAPVAAVAVALARARGGGRFGAATAFLVGVLVGASPATLHNLNRGDFVLIASSGGENFYIGNQRGAGGDYTPLHPKAGDLLSERVLAQQIADAESGRNLLPSEVSTFWRRKAFSEISAAPGAWLGLEWKKLARILHPGDPNDSYSFPLERAHFLTSLWLFSVPAWTLIGLGGWGIALALKRNPGGSWPLAAFVAVQALTLLVFFVNTRLRLPLLFFLAPFAGAAIVDWLRLARAHRMTWTAWSGAAATCGLTIAGFVWTTPSPRDTLRLASVLSTQGRTGEGLAVLKPLLYSSPAYAPALDQAGWLLQKQGNCAEASRRYREALQAGLAPGLAVQTRTRLAMMLEKCGDVSGAAAEHERAASDPEANAGTFYERGLFLIRQGDTASGAAELRRAAKLDPSWPAPADALRRLTSGASPPDPPQSSDSPSR